MDSVLSKQTTKKHDKYSSIEDSAISNGVEQLGSGQWVAIKRMFPTELAKRSRCQIRDRWRVIKPTLSTTPSAPDATALSLLALVSTSSRIAISQVKSPSTPASISTSTSTTLPTASVTTTAPPVQAHTLSPATPAACTVQAVLATLPTTTTSSSPSTQTFTPAKLLHMMKTLPSHITRPNHNVVEVLSLLVKCGDSPQQYTNVFGQYIAACRAPDFVVYMTTKVMAINSVAKVPCAELQNLMQLFKVFDDSIGAINGMLCGHLKACVINFEVSDVIQEEGAPRYASEFRVRKSYHDHTNVFRRLLNYLDYVNCPILQKYKYCVSGVGYSKVTSIEQAQVGRLLYELAVEEVYDGDQLTIVCCFALFDCFHIKKTNSASRVWIQC